MEKDVASVNLLIRGDSLAALERLTGRKERVDTGLAPHESAKNQPTQNNHSDQPTQNNHSDQPTQASNAPDESTGAGATTSTAGAAGTAGTAGTIPLVKGQVKMIYIDPPYNTGNTFAYHDARDKDAWAAMMQPRLVLAREALRDDGLIFISIDINEFAELKALCDRVFGAENFVANFVWVSNLKGRQLGNGPAGTHEYILCYAREARRVGKLRGRVSVLRRLMPAVYRLPKRQVKRDARGEYVTKNELYNTNSKFNEVTSPSLVYAIHYNQRTGEVAVSGVHEAPPGTPAEGWITALPHPNARPGLRWHAWRWSRERVLANPDDLEFEVVKEHLVIRTKIRDFETTTLKDLIMGPSTRTGQRELERLGLGGIFETPKPVDLLAVLLEAASAPGDLVLDFFAGSGSFGVAAADGLRRFILVQLPEPFSPLHEARARDLGFDTIADLTAERLRRCHVAFREIRLG
ncbi:site-specific DNA-methyltransferase [Mobiluncus mulieris]|uniref:site-specific DNA-methyltransferase n=1 Tax=Mobiluncus mulieris TaxID=2052 RepID=UPI00242D8FE6|nr:site-specific DNA-methyltransferase [Mobiluncus mulieris]